MSPLQMLGCVFIVLSIPMAKLSDIMTSDKPSGVTVTMLIITQISALLSTVGAVAVEVKNVLFYCLFFELLRISDYVKI